MRRLNIVEKRAARFEPAEPCPLHQVTSGGVRVFLDPGTLEAFAAESEGESAPLSEGLEASFPPPRPPRTGPSAICLSVTYACNLACRYCYVRANGRPPATMSRETARRAIDLLRPPGPWRIGFFGGEPLVAWDLVREIVESATGRAQALGAKVRFSITTNGTLVTLERAEFLARHGFSLIVSLDGPRELHDEERATPGGAGSFDAVIEGLQIAAAAGLGARTTLRSTFPLARPELVARLEFLNALADDGFARAVSVEPAWPTATRPATEDTEVTEGNGRAVRPRLPCHSVSVPSVNSVAKPFVALDVLAAEYLAAARWAVERIDSGKRLRFHHVEKALERILLMRPAGTECGAGFGYIEIAPSGEVHACHKAVGGAIGTVTTSPQRSQSTQRTTEALGGSSSVNSVCSVVNDVAVAVSERLRASWLDNRWYARSDCTRCWARNVCGGGCRAEALEHAGSLSRTWPVACAVKKAQVRAALYVAAVCSREKLAAHLGPRARRARRDRQETDVFHTARRGRE